MTWQFTLSGFLIGALVGVTGMGGGSLLTPILVIFFGFKPTLAVGTDILHGAIFKSFGAVRHRRLGTVHAHLTFWMFLGSGPMSLAGVALATWISHHYGAAESIESYAIGIALVLGGTALVAKTFIKRGVQPDDAPFLLARRDKLIAFTLGATCGFVVGLTSVGSGTFFGLVMVLVFPLTLPKIVGTDIFHAAALLWVAGFGHLVAGNVDLRTMGWLLTGSIPGILLTSHYTLKLPDRALRLGLACVLMLSGIKLIDFAGATYVIAVGAVVAGIGFATWGLVARLGRRNGAEVAPRTGSG
ncbi:MAG TPA: sulfite exporter TauE/SafE family protein [Gaiellaceae bacterium]|nr:sulfite exporter TauE/SafE family protein [Gaiellaceae bacterium]